MADDQQIEEVATIDVHRSPRLYQYDWQKGMGLGGMR